MTRVMQPKLFHCLHGGLTLASCMRICRLLQGRWACRLVGQEAGTGEGQACDHQSQQKHCKAAPARRQRTSSQESKDRCGVACCRP